MIYDTSVTERRTKFAGIEKELESVQLSFSTAELEDLVFHEAEHITDAPPSSLPDVTLLVVHGQFHPLEVDATPGEGKALTPESGLFRTVGLEQMRLL